MLSDRLLGGPPVSFTPERLAAPTAAADHEKPVNHDDSGSPADTHALTARLTHLEDLEALRALKARYAHCTDDNHRAASHESALAAADLFVDDAVLDIGPVGRYVGRAAILHAYESLFPAGTAWSAHYLMNPVLKVTGATATGIWYLLLYTQPRVEGSTAVHTLHGRYEEKYVKTAAGWRFQEVIGILTMP